MYWGDYLGGTMHFSTFQHGCYTLLIAAYWQNGGALPADPMSLARICRTSCDKLARYGNPVLAKFTTKDGLLYHQRIDIEIYLSSHRQAVAVANGRAGGLAKSKLVTVTYTEERKKKASAPNGAAHAGNGQVYDPVKDLFDTGVRILALTGISDRQARTIVGKWRKDVPDEKLIGFIAAASKATDPVAYIEGAIRKFHKPHGEALL